MVASTLLQVRAASAGSNVAIAPFTGTLDGLTLLKNELILLKDQTNTSQNGIWEFNGGGNNLTRPANYNTWLTQIGAAVTVTGGAVNANTQWICVSPNTGTLNTSELTWALVPDFVVQKTPTGLDVTGATEMQSVIQAAIDSLVQYNYAQDYRIVTPLSGTSYSLQTTDSLTLFQVRPTGGAAFTFTLPNLSFSIKFTCVVVLMGPGSITFSGNIGTNTITNNLPGAAQTLSARFQAAVVTVTSTGPMVWALADSPVTGGGTIYIPPGNYAIGGAGIKMHPAVSLVGDNLGSSILNATSTLVGTSDASGQEKAFLYVCARAPFANPGSTDMFQPTIRDLQFGVPLSITVASNINGICLEQGAQDPYYNGSSNYAGSSATILRCSVVNFTKFGVFCQADRQRLYCEYLRCLTNVSGGINILGNDAVLGPRCGFGSNSGTQVQASDCSGLIMSGVNVWDGKSPRSTTNLGVDLQNINGATISGCVFNEMILIDGGSLSNADTGIVISGCDFNPNDDVFSGGIPVGTGLSNTDYDTFIRVSGMRNVVIAGNTFCAAGTQPTKTYGAFKYLIAAISSAEVSFIGSAKSGTEASYRTQPVYASGAMVSFDLRDVTTGGGASGSLGASGAALYPEMRGVDPANFGSSTYSGYSAVDGGPLLQLSSPELADGLATLFWTAASGDTIPVPAAVRYLIVTLGTGSGVTTLTINLQPGAGHILNDSPLTVVFRSSTGTVGTLTWEYNTTVSPPPMAGTDTLPTALANSDPHKYELLFRGSTAKYYILSKS
jgi:hypothetical protein